MMRTQETHDESLSFVEVLRVVYKYRISVIGIPILVTIVTCLLVSIQPRKYQAVTTFFPTTIGDYISIQETPEIPNKELRSENVVKELLNSHRMLLKITQDLNLVQQWNISNEHMALIKLKQGSQVNLRDGIFKVENIGEDQNLVAIIANAFVTNLELFNRELNLSKNRSLVTVIDVATRPTAPVSRNRVKVALQVFGGMFVFMIMLSFIREYTDVDKISERIRGAHAS